MSGVTSKTDNRIPASVSLDLDNLWSYLKTHGERGWESFPSYLDCLAPRVLEVLRQRRLTITFFVVGQDAALPGNHAALRSLADAGHEIGNHSFKHEQRLHQYSMREIDDELALAEAHILAATGKQPIGFRGPGYSFSANTLESLAKRGYLYDASTFPTYMGPLARAYYFMTSRMSAEEKQKRSKLFGTMADGRRPLNPYLWQLDQSRLLEIPVTTFPGLKVPIHASYIHYLSSYSPTLALLYFKSAMRACRMAGIRPSLLLHPLDFFGADDVPELAFFPAMNVGGAAKTRLVGQLLDIMARDFEILPMARFAVRMADETLPVVDKSRAPRLEQPEVSIGETNRIVRKRLPES